jgi:uncharacterized protein
MPTERAPASRATMGSGAQPRRVTTRRPGGAVATQYHRPVGRDFPLFLNIPLEPAEGHSMSENPQYPPPAEGQYQQPYQPGYPAPGPQPAVPQAMSDSDQRLWASLGHFGGIILGFVAPLIVMLIYGEKSPYVKRHSTEALNFQITMAIAHVVSAILWIVLIGILLTFALVVVNIIFCIMGGMAAQKGQEYRYPVNIRLVK